MHNFFRPGRNGNSAGSEVTHRPMAAEINRCRLNVMGYRVPPSPNLKLTWREIVASKIEMLWNNKICRQIPQAFRNLIRFFSMRKSAVTDCRSTDQGYKLWPVFSEQKSEKHVDFFWRDALFYQVIICISVWFRLIIIMSEYCVQEYLVKIKWYLKRGNQKKLVQVFMYPGLSLKYLNIYIGN